MRNIIKLNDHYSLEKLSDCISLICYTSKVNKKTGKAYISEQKTYYGSIRQALRFYLDNCVDEAEKLSDIPCIVAYALATIDKARDEINEKFRR